ncbi:MAG: hypothetical protein KGZ80_03830 [Methylomonas sp.]|nr:hypothetical protein [Methylomonas sp.]PPD22827.1 MAG: hypothetical protein CTY23_00420 [Methylomonas sp.]PPD25425.1 MAG: hypothetical protein CTY22_08720 [Methylomonas sp.]PPD42736.1 MAG: hypothetical protein CTY17_00045 [Methylomonas sp.]PPD51564.1 MAG: hypothetical protein CTY11_11625 [Methylomonas sp.]
MINPSSPVYSHDDAQGHAKPPRKRWRLFWLIVLPCLLVSQTVIFMQPAIYQSVATVLTTAPTELDQVNIQADNQHVAIQSHVLLGQAVLEATAKVLTDVDVSGTAWDVVRLKGLLNVMPVENTNLVKLVAEGSQPEQLRLAINVWIDSYMDARRQFIAHNTDDVSVKIQAELRRIQRQIEDKRLDIDQFRARYAIVSDQSADNQAHARLQGLNQSLNKALEDEVKAKARLDTVQDAIAQGRAVLPEDDTRTMAVLLQQAEKLREELAELEGRFTAQYIELNPNLRKVKEQLAEIESKIAQKNLTGRDYAIQEAQNHYLTAKQAVAAIQAQQAEHKRLASDHTSRFSELQAMQQALLKLETLQHETQLRLAAIDAKQRQNYPQVDVVEPANLPDKSIKPDYLTQSLVALAVVLGLALSAIIITDYLNAAPPMPPDAPTPYATIELHHRPRPMIDVDHQPIQASLNHRTSAELVYASWMFARADVIDTFQSAAPEARCLMALVCNGLTSDDILALNAAPIDPDTRTLTLKDGRKIPANASLLATVDPFDGWPLGSSQDALDALLCCAAIDANMPDAAHVSVESLRDNYIAFLVGQGIKLTDLVKIVGPLSNQRLTALARSAPETLRRNLDEVDTDYLTLPS